MVLQLWEPIPEDFIIPNISGAIICDCKEQISVCINKGETEIVKGNIKYFAYLRNKDWDISIESSNNDLALLLEQHREYSLFLILLKCAHEFWVLEEILSPQWWWLYNLLFWLKGEVWDLNNYSEMLEDIFWFFEVNLKTKKEERTWPNIFMKWLHWSWEMYSVFRNDEKILIHSDEWDFIIHKSELIQYLRLLICSWLKNGTVCTPWYRYKYIINFLFSEDYQKLKEKYESL